MAQNTTQTPAATKKTRWVPAWTSCTQVTAFMSPLVPAFLIYTRKIYEKAVGDEVDRDTVRVLKLAALGTAVSSTFMVAAYLPDCICRICEAASDDGCSGC